MQQVDIRNDQARSGLASLAAHSGRTLPEIVALAEKGELRTLFGADGRLITRTAAATGVEMRRNAIAAKRRLLELLERRASW